MYKMVAISNALLPDERRRWLEQSRRLLREPSRNPFYPEGYQIEFDFNPEGNVYLSKPLWAHCVRYFWGSPDNELGKIATEEQMFYERRSSVPEVVRALWLKLFPPRKVGLYEQISL